MERDALARILRGAHPDDRRLDASGAGRADYVASADLQRKHDVHDGNVELARFKELQRHVSVCVDCAGEAHAGQELLEPGCRVVVVFYDKSLLHTWNYIIFHVAQSE